VEWGPATLELGLLKRVKRTDDAFYLFTEDVNQLLQQPPSERTSHGLGLRRLASPGPAPRQLACNDGRIGCTRIRSSSLRVRD
jgi:hypothetical protein